MEETVKQLDQRLRNGGEEKEPFLRSERTKFVKICRVQFSGHIKFAAILHECWFSEINVLVEFVS